MILFLAITARPALPPVEQLLPADTLFVAAIPDCAKLRAVVRRAPYHQLWQEPAMRPFREHFTKKWTEDFLAPLERDLGVRFADYSSLPQGLVAFAVTQDDWQAGSQARPGWLLLLDAREQSEALKKFLADLRKHWVASGKSLQTEKIRDTEFIVLTLSSNDVPKTLKPFFPQYQEIQELGREAERKPAEPARLVVGQVQSLLIAGNSIKAVTKIVQRLAGGAVPALAEDAAFEANRAALFRDAPAFAWFNARVVFDVLGRWPPLPPNPLAPNPLPLPATDRLVSGLGLNGLRSAALAIRAPNEGMLFELFLSAPESGRQGLFKLLAPEAKDSQPPAFVPADAVKFRRWRLDGPKAMATLEAIIAEVSPERFGTWNFLISSGEDAVKLDTPDYNLRRDLFGNLGDDFILYEKAPRGTSPAERESPPALLLIGTPRAELFLKAVGGALILRSGDALTPKTREFLGRTIYSITIPPASVPGAPPGLPRTLSYAASGGYVAFSTDTAMLEEYLRSGEGDRKSLRETAGLNEAAQQVGGQNTGLFGYENQGEAWRLTFETLKKTVATATNVPAGFNPLTASLPYARPERSLREWMDFSLLPDYDKVAKYFHYTVESGSATADGITFRFFAPCPPGLKP